MSSVISSSNTITLRYMLGRKLSSLKKVAKRMSQFEIRSGKCLKYYCMYPWIALGIAIHIPIFVNNVILPGNPDHITNLFGTKIEESCYAAKAFYSFYKTVLERLPMKTFAVFYVVVCYQMRCAIREMSSKIFRNDGTFINYQKLLRCHVSIQSTLEHIDDELSFFVLSLTLYLSSAVFFMVSVFLHHMYFFSACPLCLERITFCLFLVDSVVTFVMLTASACMVSEAYAEWRQIAKKLVVCSDTPFNCDQQKFLMCAEKNLHLTVGKIVPITRSFIVGIFGAIITYIMLFENTLGT